LIKISNLEETLCSIEEYLSNTCKVYRLITDEQNRVLLRDIQYLLFDNIAEEVKLVFYDPGKRIKLLECLCTVDGLTEILNIVDKSTNNDSVDIAIDAIFKFTDTFLSISKETQKIMLCTTEFVWQSDSTCDSA